MTIMVFDLTDEELAILVYAMEGYELEDLEQSPNMKFAYKQLTGKLDKEYKKRELDYSQFEPTKDDGRCPHCHRLLCPTS